MENRGRLKATGQHFVEGPAPAATQQDLRPQPTGPAAPLPLAVTTKSISRRRQGPGAEREGKIAPVEKPCTKDG